MASSGMVAHTGVVASVDTLRQVATVSIEREQDACSRCMAAAMCGASKGEQIRLDMATGEPLHPGDRVEVTVSPSTHRRAVALLLLLPWAAAMAIFFSLTAFSALSQGLVVLITLASVVATYGLLLLRRPRATFAYRRLDT